MCRNFQNILDMKKLPEDFNFDSWIQLYDYLKTQPIKSDSILMAIYHSPLLDGNPNAPTNNEMKTYRVTMRTVERNCWKEIQELRPTIEDCYEAKSILYSNYVRTNRLESLNKLISKLIIK